MDREAETQIPDLKNRVNSENYSQLNSFQLYVLGKLWHKHINRAVIMRTVPGYGVKVLSALFRNISFLSYIAPLLRNVVMTLIPEWQIAISLPVYGDIWALGKLILWCEILEEEEEYIQALKQVRRALRSLPPRKVAEIIEDAADRRSSSGWSTEQAVFS